MDEADTQFGGLGDEVHETEKRLTGKIQAMMSDTALRGKVLWLLMTARIHKLSPDIRRPGRVGDLIIPILDPDGDDRTEFIYWIMKAIGIDQPTKGVEGNVDYIQLDRATRNYSSASFAALRALLKSKLCRSVRQAVEICDDMIQPDIGDTRRYQTLQSLVNCTRKSLLPKSEYQHIETQRDEWRKEIFALESRGIR